MPPYKVVIFDWDGTLMDSAAHIVDSMQRAADDLRLEVPTDAAVRHIIGLALPEAILQLFPDHDADIREQIRLGYAEHFVAGSEQKSSLFAGAIELLDALQAAGSLVAVATGKSRAGLNRVLAQTGLAERFVITRCADETASKPNPLMLAQILAHTQISAQEAVMVGDTSYDLAMAAQLNMPRIGVSYGVHDVGLLHPHQPLAIVDELPQLQTWLIT